MLSLKRKEKKIQLGKLQIQKEYDEFSKSFTSKKPRMNQELFDSFSPYIIREKENRKLIQEITQETILTTFP